MAAKIKTPRPINLALNRMTLFLIVPYRRKAPAIAGAGEAPRIASY
jgi:hypothetical protein